jgi:uncharacterized lipoprotein (TIGR02269 family)
MWLLLSGLLVGCATVPDALGPEQTGCDEQPVSFEELCYQQDALLAVCEVGQCAAYRCWEVAEYLKVGQVVRTRGPSRPPLPRPPSSPQTRAEVGTAWNGPQGLPQPLQPVFIIPWNGPAPALLPPGKVMVLESQEQPRGKSYEKHHIYPQEFKEWFKDKGIDIHQWTLALEVEEHRRIHRGANGGPWNEAWRRFQKENRGATKLREVG